MPIPDKFLKPYNPQETEERIYKLWEEGGFFNPDNLPPPRPSGTPPQAGGENRKPFTIMMPPPNVTGVLHMGHALALTLEDIMIRYHRMKGDKTLWLPGADHAAIATQAKVEKEIYKKEGKTRHDLGREELLKRIEKFAKESHDTIVKQIRVMGASCDWSREAFTLDEKRSLAVRTMFKKMYDDGLIYRGNRIVNWDPKGQTTISDDEIVYEERKTKLYTFRYSKDFPISISTTRPETKLGDTAVAVNPKDERYKKYVGQEFNINFVGVPLKIKIVADDSIDMEFGTGAVGVTPAHSVIDSEIAQRHDLPMIQVINELAKITVNPFKNKKIAEARELIVAELKEKGLLEKEEEITHNIALAERTGGIVEPLPKLQWFVDVNKRFKIKDSRFKNEVTLKEIMRKPLETGEIKIIPDYFTKTYFHWIDNLRDWCISRQIWYGHRIPVWYHEPMCIPIPGREEEISQCEEIVVGKEMRDCPHCGAKFIQDEDTLDTWFSSALWTFSTLGWPGYTNVLFLRHGESTINVEGIIGGQIDSPLTDKGRMEAIKATETLKNYGITKIISSDLSRAKETAEIIAKICECKIKTYKELREIDVGKISNEKLIEGYPSLQKAIDNNTGEGLEELEKRARAAIEIILAEAKSTEKLLVVGHRSFFSVINAVKNGLPKEKFVEARKLWIMDNTGIKEMVFPALSSYKNKDLEIFHPTDILETGYEIIFFWVARMIMMSGYALDQIPFHTVYLHGTVRDERGRKMSKSLGNSIDPIDIAAKYGADAIRMALIIGVGPGTDMKISEDKIRGYKHFTNKIWNIARFVLENTEPNSADFLADYSGKKSAEFGEKDKELMEEFEELKKDVTKDIEEFRFYLASEKLYHYTWHRFADIIIEESKKNMTPSRQTLLKQILIDSLKLLHPFTPFVTEEIWNLMGNKNLIIEPWPI